MADRISSKVHQLAAEQAAAQQPPAPPTKVRPTRSLTIAKAGLRTGFDTINMLTATITDVLEEEITTNQANVVVNAIGKVLKVVELQQKYGKPKADGRDRDLVLSGQPLTVAPSSRSGGAAVPLEN
jgi:hypothetical protein